MQLFSQFIESTWYRKNILSFMLLPLSAFYWIIISIREFGYRIGIFSRHEIGVPVVVVGNLTIGGTGKTPLVAKVAEILVDEGFSPGIVSRGYKSQLSEFPHMVDGSEAGIIVGDEPLLLYEQTRLPVIIDPDRVRGSRELVQKCEVDIIINDDGLQHMRLSRSIEIIVIDGNRRFGNNYLLPAGPLREPTKRLVNNKFVVANGGIPLVGEYQMNCSVQHAIRLVDGERRDLSDFASKTIHAIAGIGNPQSFFSSLTQVGINVEVHPFPDHHPYNSKDLESLSLSTVLMTSKDAVKCRHFAGADWWDVPMLIELDKNFKGDFVSELVRTSISSDDAEL